MGLDTGTSTPVLTRDRRRIDPLTIIAIVVLVVGLGQMAVGAVSVGVTWDEPTHVERTQVLLDDGWFLPGWQLVDGEPDGASPFVYGPAYSMTAHAANVVVGTEAAGQTSRSASAYAVRHLTIAVLSALAVAAAGVTAWTISGRRRIGLFAAAALVAIPAWTGHSMFNIKDVPGAVGYTLVTAGLVMALSPAQHGPSRRARRWLVGPAIAVGVFIGIGTRLAFWVPIGASVAVYLAVWVLLRHRGRDPSAGGSVGVGGLVGVGAGCVAGLAGIAALYPRVFATPAAWLVGSVSGSATYPWDGVTLTAGRLLPSLDLPWWYLPAWFGATMPVAILGLAVVGLALTVRWLVTRTGDQPRWEPTGTTGAGVLVAQQALLLPLASIVVGAVMYDGLRQHLYVVPALAVLAALGVHEVQRWLDQRAAGGWVRPAVVAVLGLALLVPTVEQAALFPYNYTYVSVVGGIGGVDGRWETDYWKASGREAVTRVPVGAELICSGLVRPHRDDGPFYGPCQDDVTTFEHLRGTDTAPSAAADAGTWVIGRRREANHPPDHCRRVDDVTRWLRGEQLVMAFVLVCDPDGF